MPNTHIISLPHPLGAFVGIVGSWLGSAGITIPHIDNGIDRTGERRSLNPDLGGIARSIKRNNFPIERGVTGRIRREADVAAVGIGRSEDGRRQIGLSNQNWEIGKSGFSPRYIRKLIGKYGNIKKEFIFFI